MKNATFKLNNFKKGDAVIILVLRGIMQMIKKYTGVPLLLANSVVEDLTAQCGWI